MFNFLNKNKAENGKTIRSCLIFKTKEYSHNDTIPLIIGLSLCFGKLFFISISLLPGYRFGESNWTPFTST